MFDKTDILKRLREGTSIEAIAKEMSDALNAANDAFAEEETKRVEEERAKVEAQRMNMAKKMAVDAMLDAMCDYLVAAGEDELIDEVKEIDVNKVIELLDGSIKMAKSLENLKNLEFSFEAPVAKVKRSMPETFDADAILKEFLRGL